MASYNFSGGNSVSGYNMGFFGGVAGDIIGIVSNVFSTSRSATHVTYDDGQGTILTINGTFTGFDVNGDPTGGTATSFSLTTSAFQSPPPGVPTTITGTGLSLAVPTLIGWITTGNTLALQSALFGGADTFTGTQFNDVILSYEGNDTIDAGDGDDDVNGGAGSDIIDGGLGNDMLNGGTGADTLNGGDGDDQITTQDADIVDGGAGSDRVGMEFLVGNAAITNLGMNTEAGVTFSDGTFVRNVEIVEFFTGAGNDTLTVSSTGAAVTRFYAGAGIDTLVGEFSQATFEVRLNPSRPGFVGLFTGAGLLDLVDRYVITSGSAADTLIGWSLDDVLSGGGGNDELEGADGNDTLNGGDGDDILRGGSVNLGGGGNDALDGGAGNDTLVDSVGTNTLLGGDGNDIIQGTNDDTIDGGAGFDRLRLDLSALTTSVSVSTSPLGFSVTGATINAVNMESADLTSGSGNDSYAVSGFTSGDFFFDGGAGVDLLNVDFSTALDDLRISYFSVSYFGPSFNLHLFAPNVEQLVATGGAGNDELFGGALGDILNGGAGNDRLNAGDGADQINGGAGNDLIERYGIGSTVDGGAGLDTAYLSGNELSIPLVFNFDQYRTAAGGDFAGSLLRNFENFIAFGGAIDNTYNFATLAGSISIAGGFGLDRINMDFSLLAGPINVQGNGDTVGASGQMSGSVNANLIDFVSVLGSSSNDFMRGIGGVNLLSGGGGHDDIAGDASGDTLVGGAGNDFLSGGAGNDTISGGLDADTLDGGGGADALIGGAGDDAYFVDTENDIVAELVGEGTDSVHASATYFLFDEVENLTLTGAAAINGSGNALANVIVGNAAANQLFGLAGADTLDGGAGADSMFGGEGDDLYIVDNVADFAFEAQFAWGLDLVQASVSYALGQNIDNLTLVGAALVGNGNLLANAIVGNSNANTLFGMAGNDTLNGGGGVDSMFGGLGDDTYVVDNAADQTFEAQSNWGNDTAQTSVTYQLGQNIDNLVLQAGAGALTGRGNILNNMITGNESANTLFGFAGNDTLNGGLGADQLYGREGDDTYIVDNVNDVVSEANAAWGTDTIQASVTYFLAPNLENLTLTGAAAINGNGNTLNNVMIGNGAANNLFGLAGNDTLDGGAGADSLFGGEGDDLYIVDNAGDVGFEGNVAWGVDLVQASVSHVLGTNLDNLTLTGVAAINGTGNGLANVINGNGGANTLSGLGGADTLNGGAGNDALDGGAGDDAFVFAPGSNSDTVTGFIAGGAEDSINLSAYNGSGVTWSIAQVGADTVFSFTNGDQITLTNVTAANLVQTDPFGYS